MQRIEHASFTPFVARTFSGERDDLRAEFDLLQVHVKSRPPLGSLRENPFTLVFRCARKVILPQGLYRMATTDFDPMMIFIAPVGADADGIIYHAVFD